MAAPSIRYNLTGPRWERRIVLDVSPVGGEALLNVFGGTHYRGTVSGALAELASLYPWEAFDARSQESLTELVVSEWAQEGAISLDVLAEIFFGCVIVPAG